MSIKDYILELPLGYAMLSAQVNGYKVAAIQNILKKNNRVKGSVLDVGCGPGSNANIFSKDYDYLGVDLNHRYITFAAKSYPHLLFQVGDATKLDLNGKTFNIVLINSLMHHLDDQGCNRLMTSLQPVLDDEGLVIIQEPLIPNKNRHFMRLMMKQDRGKYFRSLDHWDNIFLSAGYRIFDHEFYTLKLFGTLTGWQMYSALLTKN